MWSLNDIILENPFSGVLREEVIKKNFKKWMEIGHLSQSDHSGGQSVSIISPM